MTNRIPARAASTRVLLTSTDLIGCRYRLSRDLRADAAGDASSVAAPSLQNSDLPAVFDQVPNAYRVIPGPDADLDTLEAIIRGEPVIIDPVLSHQRPTPGRAYSGIDEISTPSLLVKIDDAPHAANPTYMPVMVVPHRLLSSARKKTSVRTNVVRNPLHMIPVARLGRPGVLGRSVRQGLIEITDRKFRHHGPDAVKVGQAAAILHRFGVSSGFVGVICRTGNDLDATNIIVVDEASRVASYRMALRDARDTVAATKAAEQAHCDSATSVGGSDVSYGGVLYGGSTRFEVGTWPLAPRKIRECRTCHYQDECAAELRQSDDISLLLPGDKANPLRKLGIDTVSALANADDTIAQQWSEPRWLARAHRAGKSAIRKVKHTTAPRADIEMDIDMEAYPHDGAYLWGTWVPGEEYRPFVTWAAPGPEGLGGTAEAHNFALFWDYLCRRRRQAEAEGKSFIAYCWAAEGENFWLRRSANLFGGYEFVVSGADVGVVNVSDADSAARVVRVPTRAEVDEFIASPQWVDMFRETKQQLLSLDGLSVKTVAPLAGFHWRDEDVDGEASLDLYRIATGWEADRVHEEAFLPLSPQQAKEKLLRYNGDDCRSVAAVRDWLESGRAEAELALGADL